MSYDSRTLAALLPAILRIRDAELAAGMAGLLTPEEQTELQGLELAVGTLTPTQQLRLQVLRDKRLRGPLDALVAVIAEQVAVLEADLDQLYDDQFIETCADWVVPYPKLTADQQKKLNETLPALRTFLDEHLDPAAIEVGAKPLRAVRGLKAAA